MDSESKKNKAIIAIGTNTDSGGMITDRAVEEISSSHGVQLLQVSRRLLTHPIPVGGVTAHSHKFLNCLVSIVTDHSYEELNARLKEIEGQAGATREDKRKGIVTLDLDILSYNDKRYHEADWNREYIQTLMQNII